MIIDMINHINENFIITNSNDIDGEIFVGEKCTVTSPYIELLFLKLSLILRWTSLLEFLSKLV